VNCAVHLCLINGVAVGVEVVDDYADIWVIVIDLLILRIGIEIEKPNS
jgi:hypothetical protein